MSTEKTYINHKGQEVFTSHYLSARKTCCKTGCLHCPYGFTLKKFGLQFNSVDPKDYAELEKISGISFVSLDSSNIQWIILKEEKCGFFIKNHIVIKNLFVFDQFKNQGLSKEMIESYFF